jgi:hypothetical protein
MKTLLPLLLFAALCSCSSPEKPAIDPADMMHASTKFLQAGGLYLTQNEDSTWSVTKILVLDDFAAHIRMYSDTFKTKPADLHSKDLHVLIGHAPMDRDGFLLDKPEILKVEPVMEEELEGYKLYLEAMQGN